MGTLPHRVVLGVSDQSATSPSKEYLEYVMIVIYDLTKEKMMARIAAAKKRFQGLRFMGCYADTWTSRRGQGFIAIEISPC